MSEVKSSDDLYTLLRTVIVPDHVRSFLSDDPGKESTAEVAGFATYVLETMEEEAWTTNSRQVFFRRKMGRPLREAALPAYALLEEEGALHLFSFLYDATPSAPEVLEQRVIEREKVKLETLVEQLRGTEFDLAQLSDEPALPDLEAIRRFVRSDKCKVIKYFVITNQKKSERSRVEKGAAGKVFSEVIDIERLFKWSRGVASRSEIEVTVSELMGVERLVALAAPQTSPDVATYITVLPGRFLAELYETYDNRLLELNVRSYLSAKSGVNKGIIDTIKDAKKRGFFLPYNNGIVLVVDDLRTEHVATSVEEIKWMKGLQIVNGGQTTASLFKARREMKDPAALADVYVQAKILHLKSSGTTEDLVKAISRYANSQNKVAMADLGANEAFHRRLEKLAASEMDQKESRYWTYERMRNSYATQLMLENSAAARKRWQDQHPKERLITKTDLAKYMLAWDRQPWLVAKGAQKCFNAFSQSYHVRPITSDQAAESEITRERFHEIVGKVILYRTAHHIVRSDRDTFTSNQINIASYTVAYLSHRTGGKLDWELIWKSQGLSTELQTLMKAYARRVAQFLERVSAGKLASEVSKREGLFADLTGTLSNEDAANPALAPPASAPEVPAFLAIGDAPPNAEDEENIAEVMSYSAEKFARIRAIAAANRGSLSEYHFGVIENLDELAQRRWAEPPKPKQAKMFLNALGQLENYGFWAADEG